MEQQQRTEQDVKAAARRLIARMSKMATHEEDPADVAHYQSLLAQLALAQLALTYPRAILGSCLADGSPMYFVAGEDGLYVRCCGDPNHGFKVGGT